MILFRKIKLVLSNSCENGHAVALENIELAFDDNDLDVSSISMSLKQFSHLCIRLRDCDRRPDVINLDNQTNSNTNKVKGIAVAKYSQNFGPPG